jgi:hypothetical protein
MEQMRQPSRALLVAVFVFCAAAPALAQTAGEMLHACQTLQHGIRIKGNAAFLPSTAEAQQCWGFMSAVQEYSVLSDQAGSRLLGGCPAPDIKTTQIVDMFVKYASSHPDKSDVPAAVAAYDAMANAFPCP